MNLHFLNLKDKSKISLEQIKKQKIILKKKINKNLMKVFKIILLNKFQFKKKKKFKNCKHLLKSQNPSIKILKLKNNNNNKIK